MNRGWKFACAALFVLGCTGAATFVDSPPPTAPASPSAQPSASPPTRTD